MNFAKMFAVLIVSVGVFYGIYQTASESGKNERTNSPVITENGRAFVGEIGNRNSSP